MANATEQRKAYFTDLTDEQWAVVRPLIPDTRNAHRGRPRTVCLREVLNTILYLNRTGCQWDMLPHGGVARSEVRRRPRTVAELCCGRSPDRATRVDRSTVGPGVPADF